MSANQAGSLRLPEHQPQNTAQGSPQASTHRLLRPVRAPLRKTLLASVAVLMASVGISEALGWPFLRVPVERALASVLERPVTLSMQDADANSGFSVRFLGGLHARAALVDIGGPTWRPTPSTLQARDVELVLAYSDLWRARSSGQPLRIRYLTANQLHLELQRMTDGRATWQLGKGQQAAPAVSSMSRAIPQFDQLAVTDGTINLQDAIQQLDLNARLRLIDGLSQRTAPTASSAFAGPTAKRGLQASATGEYHKEKLKIEMTADGVLPWVVSEPSGNGVPVRIEATVGDAHVNFFGAVASALAFDGLIGHFEISGQSLAALGDPLGVTLPNTGLFNAAGWIKKKGELWSVMIEQSTVGSSKLKGAFTYDRSPAVPLLSGQLGGAHVLLADLAPAIGGSAGPTPRIGSGDNKTTDKTSKVTGNRVGVRASRRLLPTREFNLPSLRAMNANVNIDIDKFDLGSAFSEQLQPFRGQLLLSAGKLELRNLQARTAAGEVKGQISLDGSGDTAQWRANLSLNGVHLERLLRQSGSPNAAPLIAGELGGHAEVQGQGRSTAQLLGSLQGSGNVVLENGAISHLRAAALGIDLAKILNIYLTGDKPLPIDCASAEVSADQGVIRPHPATVVTRDSSILVTGAVSLADESLDLRVVVAPRHFSLATLRTPIQINGSFSDPAISLEGGPIATRVVASAALAAAAAPVAAILPLLDPGDADKAQKIAATCRHKTK